MAKKLTFWCAEMLNGESKGEVTRSVTMKDLAGELGMPYSTAKTKRPVNVLERVVWAIENRVYEVWFDEIK